MTKNEWLIILVLAAFLVALVYLAKRNKAVEHPTGYTPPPFDLGKGENINPMAVAFPDGSIGIS